MEPEIAFYYPNPIWYQGDWIKNLILFFDGIGLLVPEYMKERTSHLDPAIIEGLRQHKLLHVIEPERAVDKSATEKLATALTDIIVSGALDPLAAEDTAFHELSMSRLGYFGDPGLAQMLFEELRERNLAQETEDGVSIPMHPMVRSLVLTLLAQILRPYGETIGATLSPVTDRPQLVHALAELLSLPNLSSSGRVVAFDLLTVGVDLGPIPIDEVLEFRREHYGAFSEYRRNVRRFVWEIGQMPQEQQQLEFDERQATLEEIAAELRKLSRKAWRKPASFALSLAGAAWTVITGDPFGAVFAAGGSLLGFESGQELDAGAYSYLFAAQRRFT